MDNIISVRIKKAMFNKQVSQADIVKNTGLSKGAVSSYISGRYTPKQSAIYKLAKYLDVSPSWLMGFDDGEIDKILIDKINSLNPNQKMAIINIIDNMKL